MEMYWNVAHSCFFFPEISDFYLISVTRNLRKLNFFAVNNDHMHCKCKVNSERTLYNSIHCLL